MFKIYDHKVIIGILVDWQFEEFHLQVVEFEWRGIFKGKSAYQKLFHFEHPAACKGKLTANPSGKFCMPIPMAKFLKQ